MENYKSQHGQDKYINEIVFKNKTGGTFLDVGAHDGSSFSNSKTLNDELGWKGICVEPNPEVFEKLKLNRPNTININGCISDKTGKDQFLKVDGYCEMLSGLISKYDPQHMERVNRELAQFGGSKKIIDVECYNINELLEKYNMLNIDYCSLDIEGGELDVLKSIDFGKVNIKAFSIENNDLTNKSIRNFMESNGYELIEILGCDEVYLKI